MEKKEFVELMGIIQSIYEIKAKDAAGFKVWFKLLGHLDYNLAEKAVYNLGSTVHGFLSPAQIIKECDDILNPKVNIVDAMQLLNHTVRVYGRYQHQKAIDHIKEKNPCMYEVVKAIGYRELCNCNPEFIRGNIERMYKAVVVDKDKVDILGNYKNDIAEIKQLALGGE